MGSYMKLCCALLLLGGAVRCRRDDEDDAPYDPYSTTDPAKREPSPCEICKFFVTELMSRLVESGKSKEIIRTGHGLEKKKSFRYDTSELRLIEALHEPHICQKLLEYNVHAEREGSRRYAKGMSETFETLHGLVDKGVKVELGIPYELWDQPSAEVTKMNRACFKLAEEYEDVIENWYYNKQDQNLIDYLCRQRYLHKVKWDKTCLDEVWTGTEKRKDLQGDTGEQEEQQLEEQKEVAKPKKNKAKKNKKGDEGIKAQGKTEL